MQSKALLVQSEKLLLKIFAAVAALAVIVRLFSIAIVPVAAYSDSVFHLQLAQAIVAGAGIDQGLGFPPPFFHVFAAVFSVVSGFSLNSEAVRVIPLVFSLAFLLSAFVFFRRFFSSKPLLCLAAFSFVAAQPLLVRYGSINYVDGPAAMFVLLSFFFLFEFQKTGSKSFLAMLLLSSVALAVTKLNSAVILPAIVMGLAWAAFSRKRGLASLAVFVVLLAFFSSAWFALNFAETGSFDPQLQRNIDLAEQGTIVRANAFERILSLPAFLWDFVQPDAFARLPFPGATYGMAFALFSLLALASLLFIAFGFSGLFRMKNALFLPLLAALVLAIVPLAGRNFDARIAIPFLPLLALPFGFAFEKFSRQKALPFFALAFALLSLYGVAYAGATSVYFKQAYDSEMPAYSFMKGLPDDAKVYSWNRHRAVMFYSGKNSDFDLDNVNENDPEAVFAVLSGKGYSHLFISCNERAFPDLTISALSGGGKMGIVFSDGCSRIFKINYGT